MHTLPSTAENILLSNIHRNKLGDDKWRNSRKCVCVEIIFILRNRDVFTSNQSALSHLPCVGGKCFLSLLQYYVCTPHMISVDNVVEWQSSGLQWEAMQLMQKTRKRVHILFLVTALGKTKTQNHHNETGFLQLRHLHTLTMWAETTCLLIKWLDFISG